MKKGIILCTMCIAVFGFTFCSGEQKKNEKQGLTLVWEENFNGTAIDNGVWSKIPRGTSDWNNYMSDYGPLYEVRDGNLILRGIENTVLPNDTAPFLTGGVYTKGKKTFGEGRLEINAKLNGAIGAWPAFWMLPKDAQWPSGGEIDIMERLNFEGIVYQTVHSHYTFTLNIKDPRPGVTAPIQPAGYNVYAVERYADSLVFFVNNTRTFAYPRINTDKEGQFPFSDEEFYLLLDMQLGGSWVGKVDAATLPVEMLIDWVRFYRFEK